MITEKIISPNEIHKNYYVSNNDFNKIDTNINLLICDWYIKKIPNLERFQFLQNFTLKIDLTDDNFENNYIFNTDDLLYKLNVHKLKQLNIFEITLYNNGEYKTINQNSINCLHKDKFFMCRSDILSKLPNSVKYLNLLKPSLTNNNSALNYLPRKLEYLKIYDCDCDLTNLPITLKNLVFVNTRIKRNYAPDVYNKMIFNHKIPFDCVVENIDHLYYEYMYDL